MDINPGKAIHSIEQFKESIDTCDDRHKEM